jgi:hypothetical protein
MMASCTLFIGGSVGELVTAEEMEKNTSTG